ncbi:hypothetical protein [Marispirochaeta sp.]|uniref:hypothetical protein n=1 Tax=Marispirochaeta sp. TaxID=2038653 RepID=UPI0029C62FBC|nr:hypothetical protein [Marispirochaeta sp.]
MNRGNVLFFWLIRALGLAAVLSCIVGFTQLFSAVRLMEDANIRPPDQQSLVIVGCLAILFLYQFVSIALLIRQQKSVPTLRRIRAAILFMGILSFVLMFSDLAMLQDIGHQFEANLSFQGEWNILKANFFIHLVYLLSSLAIIILYLREGFLFVFSKTGKDDALFLTLHYTGSLSGISGLVFLLITLWMQKGQTGDSILLAIPMFSLVIMSPFIFILVLWFLERIRRRNIWDDEMQSADVCKASQIAIWPTAIVALAFYLLAFRLPDNRIAAVYWFPMLFFLFQTLRSLQIVFRWRRELSS